jgi:hypothetical protein
MRMKKGYKVVFGAVCLIFIVTSILWASSDWEEAKDKKGIKVFTRSVEGVKLNEFKAECIVDAPVEVVYELIRDVGRYPEWFGNCLVHEKLETIDENNIISYHVADIPFPFADRDTVAQLTFRSNWAIGEVSFAMISLNEQDVDRYDIEELTKGKRLVRMPWIKTNMVAMRVTPDKTKVIYQGYGDPSISLPAWVMNFMVTSQPYGAMINIREEVQNKLYIERAEKKHNKRFSQLN